MAAFHYALKIKLFNYYSKDKVEYIEHFKPFFYDNPIIARIEAFRFYQSWIETLLDEIGKEYTTDKQAREELQAYLKPKMDLNFNLGENTIDLSNTVSIGIGVYFVIDIPAPAIWADDKINDHAGDEDLIHGIGNSNGFNDPTSFAFYLDNEFEYYCNNGYDYKNYNRKASYFDWQSQDVDEFEFLETPFDWTGLDDPKNPALRLTESKNYEDIIANGEGEGVEFKPALSYHFTKRTWQGKYEVNYIIAKAICAFLNSKDGGLLFIGVKDNGEIQGLNFDLNLADKANKIDYFKLDFDRVLNNFIGFSVKPIVNMELTNVKEKQICVVKVEPSKHKPVFLKTQDDKKEFWVRGNASNRQITDVEEIHTHWLNRQ